MEYAVGITLYNPKSEQLNNVEYISNCFSKTFVYDNTEKDRVLDATILPDSVLYFSTGKNDGLPTALNFMLNKAFELQCDFLCLLDQDSKLKQSEVDKIQRYIEDIPESELDEIAIVSPQVDYGFNQKTLDCTTECKWVITSGSFLNCRILKKNEIWYDKNYFVDRADADVCKQILKKKLRIIQYNKAVLKQELGDTPGQKHSNHSPLRHYYIFRDRYYYNNKYYKGIEKACRNILGTGRHFWLILFYESEKVDKIKMMFLATRDYMNRKTGKGV